MQARKLPPKVQPSGSPGRSASIHYFRHLIQHWFRVRASLLNRGPRTAWHTHPLGQTLIVTAGYGRAQRWGGPVEEIRPGDVVWFSPGEKHWHGASPTTAVTHIAIHEKKEGKVVEWMEQVTDEQYGS